MTIRFLAIKGPNLGTTYELAPGKSLLVGRGEDCDIQVLDASISRRHCEVAVKAGRAVLEDLNSTWGTIVNGRKIGTHFLKPDDVVTLGQTQLRFEVSADAAAVTWEQPASKIPANERRPRSQPKRQAKQTTRSPDKKRTAAHSSQARPPKKRPSRVGAEKRRSPSSGRSSKPRDPAVYRREGDVRGREVARPTTRRGRPRQQKTESRWIVPAISSLAVVAVLLVGLIAWGVGFFGEKSLPVETGKSSDDSRSENVVSTDSPNRQSSPEEDVGNSLGSRSSRQENANSLLSEEQPLAKAKTAARSKPSAKNPVPSFSRPRQADSIHPANSPPKPGSRRPMFPGKPAQSLEPRASSLPKNPAGVRFVLRKVLRRQTQGGFISSSAISPDGKLVAAAAADDASGFKIDAGKQGTITFWDVPTGQKKPVWNAHKSRVSRIEFSPDGRQLASVAYDEPVKLWDVSTKKNTGIFTANGITLAFHPDGTRIAVRNRDGDVEVWDVASGKSIASFQGHQPYATSVAFSPDGEKLAAGTGSGSIKLWDVSAGKNIATWTGHTETINSVVFSQDSKTLASGSDDDTLKLWDIESGQTKTTIPFPADVFDLAFGPENRFLVASGNGDVQTTIRVISPKSYKVLGQSIQEPLNSVELGSDGKTLVLAGLNLELWDLVFAR